MAERKKKIFLTNREKLRVLEEIKSGVSKQVIENKYNISARVCRRIVQHADEITAKANDLELKNKKTVKSTANPKIEAALLKWFIQKRDSGKPISAAMVQEKAQLFNEMLKESPTFKASSGWFDNFKKRHGLKKLSLKGEILSNDNKSAEEFAKLLNAKIIGENLNLENLYNADESGIYYKILLNYTFVLSTENVAAGFKENKDRFTALFCANATGSHRMPLLIIGKSAKPRDLKNFIAGKAKLHDINYLKKLDVTYSAQRSGWMNCEIFKNWYEHEFISRVLEHQKNTGISGKVLLILDNAPSHPSAEELNAINENFEVLFLPLNVTAIIQPMYQSPISVTKKNYKKDLMRTLLIERDYEKIETFLKELKLRDCLEMLSKGWSNVKQTTLQNAWKPLLGNLGSQKYMFNSTENPMYDEDSFSCEIYDSIKDSYPIYEFCEHFTKCLSKTDEDNEELTNKVKSKIEEWFNAEEGDHGWEILSDTQIVQSVLNDKKNLDDFESSSLVVDKIENIHEEVRSKIDEETDDFLSRSVMVMKVENMHEEMKFEPDENEKNATIEALEAFLKFKNWITTRVICSESQMHLMGEFENILRNANENCNF